MKKTLIRAGNITDFLDAGTNEFHVNKSMILTSGAKDYLREKKVKVVYGARIKPGVSSPPLCKAESIKKVVERIISILRNELQVQDAATVERVTHQVLQKLSQK